MKYLNVRGAPSSRGWGGNIEERKGSRTNTTYNILNASDARRPGVRKRSQGRRRSEAVRRTLSENKPFNHGSRKGVVIDLRKIGALLRQYPRVNN